MIVFQVIIGIVVFAHHVLLRSLPFEEVFAAFLLFTVLAVAGFVSSSAGIRMFLVLIKCGFCLLLMPYSTLPLLLLPPAGMELPGILGLGVKGNKREKDGKARSLPASHPVGETVTVLIAASTCAALVGAAFLLPADFILPYLGILAVSVYQSIRELRMERAAERLAARIRHLERELSAVEAKRASLEKASAAMSFSSN
jgi:hypothetical protein